MKKPNSFYRVKEKLIFLRGYNSQQLKLAYKKTFLKEEKKFVEKFLKQPQCS